MKQSERIFYYDALRALAIIGIVFCHASISFVSKSNMANMYYFTIASFFDCFRDFSIPVFVMLSGALLINRKDTLIDFFKKRISRLFIPFIFWVIIYISYSFLFIIHRVDFNNALEIFLGTSSTIGVTFWFIWMILISYIEIFIINKVINVYGEKIENFDVKLISIMVIFSLVYISIVDNGLFNPYTSRIIYFISFLTYIVFGYFIANTNLIGERINKNIIIISTLIMFAASYLYYILGYVVPHSISSQQFINLGYFNFMILFISVNFFSFFKYISSTKFFKGIEYGSVGSVVNLISKYSFGIYLSHYLILHSLKNNLSYFINFNGQNPLILIPLLVFVTLIICLLICEILSKIPYLNKVSGKG